MGEQRRLRERSAATIHHALGYGTGAAQSTLIEDTLVDSGELTFDRTTRSAEVISKGRDADTRTIAPLTRTSYILHQVQ